MKLYAPILLGSLMFSGCGENYEWRQLPEVDGVQGWLLAPADRPTQWFGQDGTSVPRFERGRLWALPMRTDSLATPTPPQLGRGNLLPVLSNFSLEQEGWQIEDPNPIRVPLTPEVCGEQCVLYEPCPSCSSGTGAQLCGACEPEPPAAPSLPSKECPPGWESSEYPDGHFECAPMDVPGLAAACPDLQRWSWDEQRCIPIAPCSPPELSPEDSAIYVDASAGAGGDGSLANPFRQIPAQATANQTIVLAPGTYSGAVELRESGVRLVGHGVCSVLTGTAGVDVLRLAGAQTQVDHLSIVSQGTGRSLVVSGGGQLDLHDALLIGDDRVAVSDGVVTARRSRFTRRGGCLEDLCRQEHAAVRLLAGGLMENVDIEGPTGLWGQFAGLTVRKTRLMPQSEGYGFFGAGPGIYTFENTTSFGGRIGMLFRADGDLQVVLTDTQIVTRASPVVPAINKGVFVLGTDQFLARVDLLRTSIESSGDGIDMNYGVVSASQLRISARARAIKALENERIHLVSVMDSWLQAGEETILVAGSDAFVGNSWVRLCPECALPDRRASAVFYDEPRFEDITPDTLEIRVAHVAAADRRVANSFSAMELYDLTANANRIHALDSRVIDGARWNVRGLTSVVEVRERFNVSDIAIQIDEVGAATCIRSSADVVIDKLSVTGPEGTVSFGAREPVVGTSPQVERWRISQGSLPSGQWIGESVDGCENLASTEISPILDRVQFR